MKKIILMNLILISIILTMSSLNITGDYETHQSSEDISDIDSPNISAQKSWTYMVYLDADCDLEAAGIGDINEMEEIGSDSNINIIVQMDRISGYDSSNGDWTGCKRYYITKDYSASSISSSVVSDIGEVNMGSSSTLSNFISWTKANYPADNYALILWDHGSGIMWGSSPGGVCFDKSSSDDHLTMSEIRSVLSSNPVDLIGFDACLMGMVEVHHEIREYVDVVVASEELEPGDGYPYNDILNYLITTPSATPEQLGDNIVETYDNSYLDYYDTTQAAVGALNSSFSISLTNFISDLSGATTGQINTARQNSQEFETEDYIDLYDFASEISGVIGASATYLMNNITNMIIREEHKSAYPDAHGLSIYFPKTLTDYSSNYDNCLFAQDYQWDEFLKSYLSGGQSQYDDEYEENDDFNEAAPLSSGIYNLICNSSDYDYFNITMKAGSILDIEVYFEHDDGDIDLCLYDPSGLNVAYSYSENDYENISYKALKDGNYTLELYQETLIIPNKEYQSYYLIINDGTDDIYEDNDYIEDGKVISVNATYYNLVCKDLDYFNITVPDGFLINISIIYSYTEGDLILTLYDSDGYLLETSSTPSNIENILFGADYYIASSNNYVIEVKNSRDYANYTLQVNISYIDDSYENNNYINWASDFAKDSTETDLVCINEDYYNISLTVGEWINISLYFEHNQGDLDLFLYYVYHWDPWDADSYDVVGFSISYTDNEVILYKAEYTGAYYIKVVNYEINFHYNLSVHTETGLWDDKFEDNDWCDTAAPIQYGVLYDNLTALDWDVYSFNAIPGYEYTLSLTYNASEGDLDLYLLYYDSGEDTAYIIDFSGTPLDTETITYSPSTVMVLYAFVYVNEINMYYNLSLSRTSISSDEEDGKDSDHDIEPAIGINGYDLMTLFGFISLSAIFIITKYRKK
ncbi:MAG: clostripain-related cysteine peptidase [Promethearchaeota archaeon]